MFSRLSKTPKSSIQLFRKNQAAMLPNDAESPQFPSENFSSLPIIWKVGLGSLFISVLTIGENWKSTTRLGVILRSTTGQSLFAIALIAKMFPCRGTFWRFPLC